MLYAKRFQNLYDVERKRIVMPDNVKLRLNRGELPEPMFEPLITMVDDYGSPRCTELQQYPSYSEFYDKLAGHLGVPKDRIVVGAGIEEFIRTIMFLCSDPVKESQAAVLWPTCAMYDIYAQAFGVDLVRIKPAPGVQFGTTELLEQIDWRVVALRALFLPNPGQPVETYFMPYQIEYLAAWCQERDIILAVDEAHFGFGAQTALPLVDKFDNLLVMRTFSKFYGAAAIRVGYVVGQPKVIKPIEAARPSGEIAGPSMTIASVLLDHQEVLGERAVGVAKARDWLREELIKMGFRAWGKRGFSILIEFPTTIKAQSVAAKLAERGVLVKVGFPEPVDRCILLSCGQRAMLTEFLTHFKECI